MRRHVVYSTAAAAAAAVLLSGCLSEPESVQILPEQRTSPIVNGSRDFQHKAVGALTHGGSLCTATLVGKFTVITASHCVAPGKRHYFVVANRYWRVKKVVRHPSYRPPSTDHDVAVVILEDAPPVKPASITSRPPVVGQQVTLVGYGAISQQGGGSGVKRVAKNAVSYVTPTRLVISGSGGAAGNVCFGDSGGPTFATIGDAVVQVGIHSTISGQCGQQAHDMRVDVYGDWIIKTAGGDVSIDGNPSPLLDNSPPAVTIDSPQAAETVPYRFVMSATVKDESKLEQAELLVDGKQVKTWSKAPFSHKLELAAGEHTLEVVGTDAARNVGRASVKFEVLPPAKFGEACASHDECGSSLCAAAGAIQYCTQLCAAANPCPLAAICVDAGGAKSACGPPPPAAPKNTGDAVTNAGGCALGGGAGDAPAAPLTLLALLLLLVLKQAHSHLFQA